MTENYAKITEDNQHHHNRYTREHAIKDARWVLLNSFAGTLATCVREGETLSGYPFNAITAFMLDGLGCPVMFGAGISEHAKNARDNGRASLLVRDITKHHRIETGWRLTMTGDLVDISEESGIDKIKQAFFRHYPHMKSYQAMHDFGFWRLVPKSLYLIMDFGKISWVSPDEVLIESTVDDATKTTAIEHMNKDHQEAILHYLQLLGVVLTENRKPRLANVHQLGMTIHYNQRLYYLPFGTPISETYPIRQAFVDLANKPLN